ncbi:MAG: hypothetical protein R3B09_30520 [Nannocystaceae bacterium]
MRTTLLLSSSLSLLLLAPLGCDQPADQEPTRIVAAGGDELVDLEGAAPGLEIVTDGEPRPDALIAAVKADPDTTLYFAQGEVEEDGRFLVDVTIIGRDGGFDYGGLLTSERCTPLELFLALTDDDEEDAPPALRRAHAWQVEATRPGDGALRDLTGVLPPPLAAFEDILHTDESTFTCLSWANFQSYMGTRFAGAPGRIELLDSAVGEETLYSPASVNNWWGKSQVDMVACNYNSSDNPAYHDSIEAEVCYVRGMGGELTTNCGHSFLDDGYYLRRIYGPVGYPRQYRVHVVPDSAAALQSYSGIVKRD